VGASAPLLAGVEVLPEVPDIIAVTTVVTGVVIIPTVVNVIDPPTGDDVIDENLHSRKIKGIRPDGMKIVEPPYIIYRLL
jgi:hypothetical protein